MARVGFSDPTPDMNAAKKFYGEVLGLHKTFEIEGWCEFSTRMAQPR